MTDIDPDKLEAALDQLEAERERRLQAKIDSGEVVSVQTVVVVDPEEDIEDAQARALAKHPVSFTASSFSFSLAFHGTRTPPTGKKKTVLRKRRRLALPRKGLSRTLLRSRLGAGPPTPAPSQPCAGDDPQRR